jgi:hypothetical protein
VTDAPQPPPTAPTPPPPPTPAAPAPPGGGGGGYPVQVDLDAPLEVKNWRPLVHWLLIIPYAIVTGILAYALAFCSFIAFFTILFTTRIPDGLYRFMAMCLRVNWRTISYAAFLREPYPSWEFTPSNADPGDDPAKLSVDEQGELNRWLPLVKWLLIIPHVIVLFFLAIAAYFAVIVGFFAVLFTGKWPAGVRDFVVGVARWGNRVYGYAYLMRDEYPPFALD